MADFTGKKLNAGAKVQQSDSAFCILRGLLTGKKEKDKESEKEERVRSSSKKKGQIDNKRIRIAEKLGKLPGRRPGSEMFEPARSRVREKKRVSSFSRSLQ